MIKSNANTKFTHISSHKSDIILDVCNVYIITTLEDPSRESDCHNDTSPAASKYFFILLLFWLLQFLYSDVKVDALEMIRTQVIFLLWVELGN